MKRSMTSTKKKVPRLFGLGLLMVALFATSYLVNVGIIFFGHAAPTDNPEDVRISNVSDSSFTVSYKTETPVIGTISLTGGGKASQTILDERDQTSGTPHYYTLHSISVKNLQSATGYIFSIISGTTTYQNNGRPFSVSTPENVLAKPSATIPFTGKLLDTSGGPAKDTLVFVTTDGGQTLSALTNNQGIYIIPLNHMLTKDLSQLIDLTNSSVLQIFATNGNTTTQAQVPLKRANPVPVMTLSSNYNFAVNTNPIVSTTASLGFPPFPQKETLTATPLISVPKKDQSFSDTQPEFKGKALPNGEVTIEIHSSDVITATVTADSYGNWTYQPKQQLSPGQHIITITAKNAEGILTKIEQSFVVYASGSQVNQTATPSATLAPTATPTPTPKPTATPILAPSVTPTLVPTATPKPTVTPTVITQGTTIHPTRSPTLPATGSNVLIVSSTLGIVTSLVGVVLFVLTKGGAL